MYQKEIVREVLACMSDLTCKMSILTTMEMAHKAWKNASAQTIANCFRTCGFIKDSQTIGKGISNQGEEVEVLLSTWNRLEVTVSFKEFVRFVDTANAVTAGTFIDDEIIQSTTTNQHNSDNDDEEEDK